MKSSAYRVFEIVGTSTTSWEDATRVAVETASQTLEDLRIAEVVKKDVIVQNGKAATFRVRLTVSFRYHPFAWLGDTGRCLEKI